MTDPASEVTQLILRERQSRDRGWYDRMLECYAADSIVDMSWFNGPGPEFVRRSQYMSESRHGWGGHSGHRLSPPAIRATATARWRSSPSASSSASASAESRRI
jgi:hypothetical protein